MTQLKLVMTPEQFDYVANMDDAGIKVGSPSGARLVVTMESLGLCGVADAGIELPAELSSFLEHEDRLVLRVCMVTLHHIQAVEACVLLFDDSENPLMDAKGEGVTQSWSWRAAQVGQAPQVNLGGASENPRGDLDLAVRAAGPVVLSFSLDDIVGAESLQTRNLIK